MQPDLIQFNSIWAVQRLQLKWPVARNYRSVEILRMFKRKCFQFTLENVWVGYFLNCMFQAWLSLRSNNFVSGAHKLHEITWQLSVFTRTQSLNDVVCRCPWRHVFCSHAESRFDSSSRYRVQFLHHVFFARVARYVTYTTNLDEASFESDTRYGLANDRAWFFLRFTVCYWYTGFRPRDLTDLTSSYVFVFHVERITSAPTHDLAYQSGHIHEGQMRQWLHFVIFAGLEKNSGL